MSVWADILTEINPEDWFTHTDEMAGNQSICLVSVGGTQNNDFVMSGALKITPLLHNYPSIQKILSTEKKSVTRVRLMRLAPKTKASQSQAYYQNFRCQTVYIPLKTNNALYFHQYDQTTRLKQGEAFSFKQTSQQSMENKGAEAIIQLVIEYDDSQQQTDGFMSTAAYFNVFNPTTLQKLTDRFLKSVQALTIEPQKYSEIEKILIQFNQKWQREYQQYGNHATGELAYWNLILNFKEVLLPLIRFHYKQLDAQGRSAFEIINSLLLTAPSTPKRLNRHLLNTQTRKRKQPNQTIICPLFTRPVFIVSAPRAGSTLLFNNLSACADLWTTGEENHELLETITGLHPKDKNYHSNRLLADDASIEILTELRQRFSQRLVNQQGQWYQDLNDQQRPNAVRFLEKTPKNALRIPFIKALFPDAVFIYLYRAPYANINSLMEGWRSRRFIAYKNLPEWSFKDWSFLLTPDWQKLNNKSIVEISAHQWTIANQTIMTDIKALSASDWTMLNYDELITDPQTQLKKLVEFMQMEFSPQNFVTNNLAVTPVTLSAPHANKWKKNAPELATISTLVEPVLKKIKALKLLHERKKLSDVT